MASCTNECAVLMQSKNSEIILLKEQRDSEIKVLKEKNDNLYNTIKTLQENYRKENGKSDLIREKAQLECKLKEKVNLIHDFAENHPSRCWRGPNLTQIKKLRRSFRAVEENQSMFLADSTILRSMLQEVREKCGSCLLTSNQKTSKLEMELEAAKNKIVNLELIVEQNNHKCKELRTVILNLKEELKIVKKEKLSLSNSLSSSLPPTPESPFSIGSPMSSEDVFHSNQSNHSIISLDSFEVPSKLPLTKKRVKVSKTTDYMSTTPVKSEKEIYESKFEAKENESVSVIQKETIRIPQENISNQDAPVKTKNTGKDKSKFEAKENESISVLQKETTIIRIPQENISNQDAPVKIKNTGKDKSKFEAKENESISVIQKETTIGIPQENISNEDTPVKTKNTGKDNFKGFAETPGSIEETIKNVHNGRVSLEIGSTDMSLLEISSADMPLLEPPMEVLTDVETGKKLSVIKVKNAELDKNSINTSCGDLLNSEDKKLTDLKQASDHKINKEINFNMVSIFSDLKLQQESEKDDLISNPSCCKEVIIDENSQTKSLHSPKKPTSITSETRPIVIESPGLSPKSDDVDHICRFFQCPSILEGIEDELKDTSPVHGRTFTPENIIATESTQDSLKEGKLWSIHKNKSFSELSKTDKVDGNTAADYETKKGKVINESKHPEIPLAKTRSIFSPTLCVSKNDLNSYFTDIEIKNKAINNKKSDKLINHDVNASSVFKECSSRSEPKNVITKSSTNAALDPVIKINYVHKKSITSSNVEKLNSENGSFKQSRPEKKGEISIDANESDVSVEIKLLSEETISRLNVSENPGNGQGLANLNTVKLLRSNKPNRAVPENTNDDHFMGEFDHDREELSLLKGCSSVASLMRNTSSFSLQKTVSRGNGVNVAEEDNEMLLDVRSEKAPLVTDNESIPLDSGVKNVILDYVQVLPLDLSKGKMLHLQKSDEKVKSNWKSSFDEPLNHSSPSKGPNVAEISFSPDTTILLPNDKSPIPKTRPETVTKENNSPTESPSGVCDNTTLISISSDSLVCKTISPKTSKSQENKPNANESQRSPDSLKHYNMRIVSPKNACSCCSPPGKKSCTESQRSPESLKHYNMRSISLKAGDPSRIPKSRLPRKNKPCSLERLKGSKKLKKQEKSPKPSIPKSCKNPHTSKTSCEPQRRHHITAVSSKIKDTQENAPKSKSTEKKQPSPQTSPRSPNSLKHYNMRELNYTPQYHNSPICSLKLSGISRLPSNPEKLLKKPKQNMSKSLSIEKNNYLSPKESPPGTGTFKLFASREERGLPTLEEPTDTLVSKTNLLSIRIPDCVTSTSVLMACDDSQTPVLKLCDQRIENLQDHDADCDTTETTIPVPHSKIVSMQDSPSIFSSPKSMEFGISNSFTALQISQDTSSSKRHQSSSSDLSSIFASPKPIQSSLSKDDKDQLREDKPISQNDLNDSSNVLTTQQMEEEDLFPNILATNPEKDQGSIELSRASISDLPFDESLDRLNLNVKNEDDIPGSVFVGSTKSDIYNNCCQNKKLAAYSPLERTRTATKNTGNSFLFRSSTLGMRIGESKAVDTKVIDLIQIPTKEETTISEEDTFFSKIDPAFSLLGYWRDVVCVPYRKQPKRTRPLLTKKGLKQKNLFLSRIISSKKVLSHTQAIEGLSSSNISLEPSQTKTKFDNESQEALKALNTAEQFVFLNKEKLQKAAEKLTSISQNEKYGINTLKRDKNLVKKSCPSTLNENIVEVSANDNCKIQNSNKDKNVESCLKVNSKPSRAFSVLEQREKHVETADFVKLDNKSVIRKRSAETQGSRRCDSKLMKNSDCLSLEQRKKMFKAHENESHDIDMSNKNTIYIDFSELNQVQKYDSTSHREKVMINSPLIHIVEKYGGNINSKTEPLIIIDCSKTKHLKPRRENFQTENENLKIKSLSGSTTKELKEKSRLNVEIPSIHTHCSDNKSQLLSKRLNNDNIKEECKSLGLRNICSNTQSAFSVDESISVGKKASRTSQLRALRVCNSSTTRTVDESIPPYTIESRISPLRTPKVCNSPTARTFYESISPSAIESRISPLRSPKVYSGPTARSIDEGISPSAIESRISPLRSPKVYSGPTARTIDESISPCAMESIISPLRSPKVYSGPTARTIDESISPCAMESRISPLRSPKVYSGPTARTIDESISPCAVESRISPLRSPKVYSGTTARIIDESMPPSAIESRISPLRSPKVCCGPTARTIDESVSPSTIESKISPLRIQVCNGSTSRVVDESISPRTIENRISPLRTSKVCDRPTARKEKNKCSNYDSDDNDCLVIDVEEEFRFSAFDFASSPSPTCEEYSKSFVPGASLKSSGENKVENGTVRGSNTCKNQSDQVLYSQTPVPQPISNAMYKYEENLSKTNTDFSYPQNRVPPFAIEPTNCGLTLEKSVNVFNSTVESSKEVQTKPTVDNNEFVPKFYIEDKQSDLLVGPSPNKKTKLEDNIFQFPAHVRFRQKTLGDLIPNGEKIDVSVNIFRTAIEKHSTDLKVYQKRNVEEGRKIQSQDSGKDASKTREILDSFICNGVTNMMEVVKVADKLVSFDAQSIIKGLILVLQKVLELASQKDDSEDKTKSLWIFSLLNIKKRSNCNYPNIHPRVQAFVTLMVLVKDRKPRTPREKDSFFPEVMDFLESLFLNIKTCELMGTAYTVGMGFLAFVYASIARLSGELVRVRYLIYDLIYCLNRSGVNITHIILKTWPLVLRPKPIEWYLGDPLSLVIIYSLTVTPESLAGSRQCRAGSRTMAQVQEFMWHTYKFNATTVNAEQLFDMCSKRLCQQGIHETLILLCKRLGETWAKKTALKLLMEVVQKWRQQEESDANAVAALNIIGAVVRSFSALNTHYDIQPVFELLKELLADEKTPEWMQEVVAMNVCRVSRLNLNLCMNILSNWRPSRISAQVLDKILMDIVSRKSVYWWENNPSGISYLNKR